MTDSSKHSDSDKPVATMSVTPRKLRNPYEQQEYQKHNPHLFTTPTQLVNADGSITTYEQVTTKIREARDKLISQARMCAATKDFNANYRFLMADLVDIKKSVDYLDAQMQECLNSFTSNYARMHERLHRGTDVASTDQDATTSVSNPLENKPNN